MAKARRTEVCPLGYTVASNLGTHARPRAVPATRISRASWGDTPRICFQNRLLHGDVRDGVQDKALPLDRGLCEPPPGSHGSCTPRPPSGTRPCPAGPRHRPPRRLGFAELPRPARLLRRRQACQARWPRWQGAWHPGPGPRLSPLALPWGDGAGDPSDASTNQGLPGGAPEDRRRQTSGPQNGARTPPVVLSPRFMVLCHSSPQNRIHLG